MTNIITPPSADFLSLHEDFVWDWYIRVKIQFSSRIDSELVEGVSSGVKDLWKGFNSIISEPKSIQLWPSVLTNVTQPHHFWFIGISTLPPPELAQCRKFLKEWQKTTKEKMDERISIVEAKFMPRKVFLDMGEFVVFELPEIDAEVVRNESVRTEKGKEKEAEREQVTTKREFKKIKGSNPQEVRRQFLQHQMGNSGSPSSGNSKYSVKLRPGREILNQLRFDSAYEVGDYVVGYIDRKQGILEMSVNEWSELGTVRGKGGEELMAYIKNLKSEEVVWDKARRIDTLGRGKGGLDE